VPPASRPVPPPAYRLDEPPGDLAGLFPSRGAGRPEPDQPAVIDLTYQERPVAASDDPPNQPPVPEHAVPPGFPVELPQPSLRREQLLLTAVSWLIVLFTTLLGALGGLTYSSVKSPTYTATSSVIVTPGHGAPVQSDPALFANNYAQVATDTPVLQPALADAGISMSADEARQHLTVSVPSGSSLITIQATAGSGADAAALANAAANGIATYGTAQAPKTGYDVSIFTPATAPTSSSTPDRALNVFVGALIGLAVGGVVVLVIRRSRRASAAAAA
jgi:capsular polysaccharide biosynthesis protein